MPELTYSEVDRIIHDIKKQEITFSHLPDDLTDHVCCAVEDEMLLGLEFEDAYRKVKDKIGHRRIQEIQEETLYAVDTKYRIMKNVMKISGIFGTVLFGFAAMFKIQHWAGAGILMTMGALILAFVFLPSALVVLWKETHSRKRIFLFISAFLTGVCFIAGTLFKVQHWPYAGLILMLGGASGVLFLIPATLVARLSDPDNKQKRTLYILGAAGAMLFIGGFLFKIQHWPLAGLFMVTSIILLSVIVFPWYTWLIWKEEHHVSPMFIFLIIGFLLIIMPSALVNLNLQHSYQEYYYPNSAAQNDMYNYLYRNNIAFLNNYTDSLSYKKMDQLHSRTISLLVTISSIQEKMVRQSESQRGKPVVSTDQIRQTETGSDIVYRNLSWSMDPYPVKDFLWPDCSTRKELDSSLTGFVSYLTSLVPADVVTRYKKMLDPEAFLPNGKSPSGETSLISGLHSLQIMKNGLLIVENSLLKGIAAHK